MTRATATELKNKMGVFMRLIRGGEGIIISDRGRDIAQIMPLNKDRSQKSRLKLYRGRSNTAPKLGDIVVKGIDAPDSDSLADLLVDRRSR